MLTSIPNPHPCAPPLPILGSAAAVLLVIAIVCAALVALALVALVNRRRLPAGTITAAWWLFWCTLVIGAVAAALAVLFTAKC